MLDHIVCQPYLFITIIWNLLHIFVLVVMCTNEKKEKLGKRGKISNSFWRSSQILQNSSNVSYGHLVSLEICLISVEKCLISLNMHLVLFEFFPFFPMTAHASTRFVDCCVCILCCNRSQGKSQGACLAYG